MPEASKPKNPVVLSYLALRKAVGYVAVGLPFALAITWWFVHGHHRLQSSISAYYYTGMRNLFVGSLCAISMFMLCCRGYDLQDEIAGIFSAFCALCVAFLPTTPEYNPTEIQGEIGDAHYVFAALLFLTLAYFCLALFTKSSHPETMTRNKRRRNNIYIGSGYAILASIALIVISKIPAVHSRVENLDLVFWFETTALIAFGIAWLTKGEAFLKDEDRDSPVTLTSNTIVGLVTSEKTRADSSKAPYSLPQQPTVQIRRG